jgi:MFS family permease
LAAQAAVQIASPYVTPFMLSHLKLDYYRYVVLICAFSVAKIFVLPTLGRVVDRCGAHRVFWLASIGIIPLPAMWLVSDSFLYLIGVQVLAGAVWAAFDLATLLLFFKTIPSEKRVGVLTAFNLANAAAIAAGSAIGGILLSVFASGRDAYLALFLLSTATRAIALVFLVRMPRVVPARRPAVPMPLGSLPAYARVRTSSPKPLLGPSFAAGRARTAGLPLVGVANDPARRSQLT